MRVLYVSYRCAHRVQKRALDPLALQSQMVVGHHVGTDTQTQVFCKSNSCSATTEPSPQS